MEIFRKIGNGEKVILIGHPIEVTSGLEGIVKKNNVTLLFISHEYYPKFYSSLIEIFTIGIGRCVPSYLLDKAILSKKYREVMVDLMEAIKKHRVTHVLLNSNMWHPKYLSKLKKLGVVLVTKIVDDPEGSKYYSKPIVRYYDKCVCSGVSYNKHRTIKDMYYKWGAKDVKFLPVFVHPKHYDNNRIDYSKKDIDIIHVGSFNWKRWVSLSILYKNFKGKIKFYSHYDPRKNKNLNGLVYRLINAVFPLPEVEKIEDDELREVYKRSKIGFNRHLSYGPSNARSYELCLNGILQITDNPKGYEKIYSVGKEVVCYKNMKEAINLIKHYLKNNAEREKIAIAGYEKAIGEYTYEEIFNKHIKYILEK